MSAFGGETAAVQDPTIEYARQIGWQHVAEEEALTLRGGVTGFGFKDIFRTQVLKLNPEFMTEELADDLFRRLERVPPNVEGNLSAWEHLKGLKTVFVPSEKRERNVTLIDSVNIDNNVFHVTEEFSFTNGTNTNRYDVALLINGIPVLFIEAKAAHKRDGISIALDQVRRYHRETPEMMAVFQLYALTHLIQFKYSATWSHSQKSLFDWKEESPAADFEDLVKAFLNKERIVRAITDYILFTRRDDELKKVVLRPHQMRGVQKIVERAMDPKKTRGLIWHTQGSGKTYTMIVAAKKLMENPLLNNPTVLMLVDRNELESQLFSNLSAVGVENIEVAESKEHLRNLLRQDRRGLIVTMIHKFEGIEPNINTRDNIFVLVDEAHRTTGGDLGNYLLGALPKASYIGFTGTPIDRTQYGKGTFITFGKDDPPKGYLDKYSIAESIEDGTTVSLRYTIAPNEMKVDRKTLEDEFLNLPEAQGLSDVEEQNKVLEKAVTLTNMMKNRERIQKIAKQVAEDFRNNVEKMGYKAFLVAVDREACALYKEELDRQGILSPDESVVVYSRGFNDDEQRAKYHLSEEEEKRIRKDFIDPSKNPKMLIVTEKLLTGFDAPILYCMYLDKPMRDHVLLQAIARVNRPYEDESGVRKPCGLVLDFVGIFENLEKALAFDSSDIEGVLTHLDRLKDDFKAMMEEARVKYLPIIAGKKADKQVEAWLKAFFDEKPRQEFYDFFRKLEDIYNILSPDEFLRPYLKDFLTLVKMYSTLRENYDAKTSVDKEIARKVAELVQAHTKQSDFAPPLEILEINEETLRKLEESKASDIQKVFNLVRSLFKATGEQAKAAPYLISIGERAERITALFKQRQIDTQEAMRQLKELVNEINSAKSEQEERGMNTDVFSIYYLAKKAGVNAPEAVANHMIPVIDMYPHWKVSEAQEREVRRELYKALAKTDTENVGRFVNDTLRILKGVAS